MHAFMFHAAFICEDCAIRWMWQNPDAIDTGESEGYPQGPYTEHEMESDSPDHCDRMEQCVNAIEMPNGRKIGMFFENPLTTEGRKYVENACKEALEVRNDSSVALEVWAPFYRITLPCDDE